MALKIQKDKFTTTQSLGINLAKPLAPEPKETEKPQASEAVQKTAEGDTIVQCRPKVSGRVYVGNKWFHYVAGEEIPLPKTVKDILHSHGVLDVL